MEDLPAEKLDTEDEKPISPAESLQIPPAAAEATVSPQPSRRVVKNLAVVCRTLFSRTVALARHQASWISTGLRRFVGRAREISDRRDVNGAFLKLRVSLAGIIQAASYRSSKGAQPDPGTQSSGGLETKPPVDLRSRCSGRAERNRGAAAWPRRIEGEVASPFRPKPAECAAGSSALATARQGPRPSPHGSSACHTPLANARRNDGVARAVGNTATSASRSSAMDLVRDGRVLGPAGCSDLSQPCGTTQALPCPVTFCITVR